MTQHILSLSYGKDSLACLGAIEKLGWPLDRIVHAEVWATDTIPADLPPMVEFKAKADEIIKRRWGIVVEHVCAMKKCAGGGTLLTPTNDSFTQKGNAADSKTESSMAFPNCAGHGAIVNSNESPCKKITYEDMFYRVKGSGKHIQTIYGFPMMRLGARWCVRLKENAIQAFIKAPIHKARKQILCSIWASRQTSLNG